MYIYLESVINDVYHGIYFICFGVLEIESIKIKVIIEKHLLFRIPIYRTTNQLNRKHDISMFAYFYYVAICFSTVLSNTNEGMKQKTTNTRITIKLYIENIMQY